MLEDELEEEMNIPYCETGAYNDAGVMVISNKVRFSDNLQES